MNCERRDKLVSATQERLIRLSELARHQADALRNGSNQLVMDLDHDIEQTLGEKERTLGALHEHRREHGC